MAAYGSYGGTGSRYEPYKAADSRYGGYGASGYGAAGGYGAGGGFGGGGRGSSFGRRDLDSMQLARPDFSNLSKFEKNFYVSFWVAQDPFVALF